MTTLTAMKARIALEMRRPNISTQIASAISTAIAIYSEDRWQFNVTRDYTFDTVAGQYWYSSSDSSYIPIIRSLDYVKVLDGSSWYNVEPGDRSRMEELTDAVNNTGMPTTYVYYGKKLRLYPAPDAVYTIRLAGVFVAAEPASDDEADNPWMTDAERLIRSRAKLELAMHVTYDANMIATMGAAVKDAEDELAGVATSTARTGFVRPVYF